MWNFIWLDTDSNLQANDLKWLDSSCDSTRSSHHSTLTRLENFLDDFDSTLARWTCDFDSKKMSRSHHWPFYVSCHQSYELMWLSLTIFWLIILIRTVVPTIPQCLAQFNILYVCSPLLMSRLCCIHVNLLVWYLTRYCWVWQSFSLHCC